MTHIQVSCTIVKPPVVLSSSLPTTSIAMASPRIMMAIRDQVSLLAWWDRGRVEMVHLGFHYSTAEGQHLACRA